MKLFSVFVLAILLLQALLGHSFNNDAIGEGSGLIAIDHHHKKVHYHKKINCGAACSRRCKKSSRKNVCHRACKSCCYKCHCVPPGTYGNKQACPCYANFKTHGNKPKCP